MLEALVSNWLKLNSITLYLIIGNVSSSATPYVEIAEVNLVSAVSDSQ